MSLEKLAPHAPTEQYEHNRTGEDNADAHMKRQIMGREVVVAITKGKLGLGPWEQIFYGEFFIQYFREPLTTAGRIEQAGEWFEVGGFPPVVVLIALCLILSVMVWSWMM